MKKTSFKLFDKILQVEKCQEWTTSLMENVTQRLAKDKAVLIRGSHDNKLLNDFGDPAMKILGPSTSYYQGGGNRQMVDSTRQLRTSDFTPDNKLLPAHNEMSYAQVWPKYVALVCTQTSVRDQCPTLVFDNRKITGEVLDKPVGKKLIESGVTYHRRYESTAFHGSNDRFFLWQSAFQADTKLGAEKKLSTLGADFEWCKESDKDELLVQYSTSGFVESDGETFLFNQAYLNNVNAKNWGNEFWKGFATYGNGESMSDDELKVLEDAHDPSKAEAVHWEPGDILLLENHFFQHGSPPTPQEIRQQRSVFLYMGSATKRMDKAISGVSVVQDAI
jgi:hypothetical protein